MPTSGVMYLGPNTNATLATRSILLAAIRGAPGYVALDVTNPEQEPKLLWQFSDSSMGDTVGKPQLVQVAIEWTTGVVQERAMAILPGGVGELADSSAWNRLPARFPSDARAQGRHWKYRGRTLYVVDVATGQLVLKFDQRHFSAPLTGSIAIDESRPIAQYAYFTDEDGVLWHLSFEGTRASDWRVEPMWDVFHGSTYNGGRPSTYAPIISTDATRANVILLGTGNIDDPADPTAHRVVSVREVRTLTSGVASTSIKRNVTTGDGQANWEIVLSPRESVTGPLTLVNGTAYFATFLSAAGGGDAC